MDGTSPKDLITVDMKLTDFTFGPWSDYIEAKIALGKLWDPRSGGNADLVQVTVLVSGKAQVDLRNFHGDFQSGHRTRLF